MKTFFNISIASFLLSFSSVGQVNTAQDTLTAKLPGNAMFMIDSLRHFRNIELFPVNSRDCFLQIFNDYAYLTYKSRLIGDFKAGTIHTPLVRIFENDTVDIFTIISDNRYPNSSFGQRTFIGVSRDFKNNGKMYLLNYQKQVEYIMKAHYATEDDMKFLKSLL